MDTKKLDELEALLAKAQDSPFIADKLPTHFTLDDLRLFCELRNSADELIAAARREEKLRQAVTEYLEWGAMTSSDIYLHECAFKAALADAEENQHG